MSHISPHPCGRGSPQGGSLSRWLFSAIMQHQYVSIADAVNAKRCDIGLANEIA